MRTIEIQEAQARFSELLRYVEAGGEVLLTRAGVHVARLTRIDQPKRQLGSARGQI